MPRQRVGRNGGAVMFGKLNLLLIAGNRALPGADLFCSGVISGEPNYELVPERQMARSPAFGYLCSQSQFSGRHHLPSTRARHDCPGLGAFRLRAHASRAARAGKELNNPLVLRLTQRPSKQGAFLYATYCQFCHGPTGNGDGAVSERGFPPRSSFLKPQSHGHEGWGDVSHPHLWQRKHACPCRPALAGRPLGGDPARACPAEQIHRNFPMFVWPTRSCFQGQLQACHGEDGSGTLLRGKLPNLPDFSSLAWQFVQDKPGDHQSH